MHDELPTARCRGYIVGVLKPRRHVLSSFIRVSNACGGVGGGGAAAALSLSLIQLYDSVLSIKKKPSYPTLTPLSPQFSHTPMSQLFSFFPRL